jgi:hypothetical protein
LENQVLQLRDLDVWIARLDGAIGRAQCLPDDVVATFDVHCCIDVLFANLSPLSLPPQVLGPFYRAVSAVLRLQLSEPESTAQVRAALLDLAAAIAVLPWDEWTSAPSPEVICPLYDT